MKLRHPALIRFFSFAGATFVRALIATLRTRVDFRNCGALPFDARRRRCIFAFWHENMLAPIKFGPQVQVLISNHADGELIAQTIHRLGMRTVRGSTMRGGSRALLELLRNDYPAHVIITPDGPRGPRRQVQPGIVYLASRSGMPIIMLGVGYEKAWRANSWDRLAVPYPFSLATYVASPPIHVPRALDSAGLESYRRLAERQLHAVSACAEQWAGGSVVGLPADIVAQRVSISSEEGRTNIAEGSAAVARCREQRQLPSWSPMS